MKENNIIDDGSAYCESNKRTIRFKVTISIIFGLLGFFVNLYPVDFVFYGSYKMSFLFGLLFPMLITLAWGWKYGLLSAICGGCQTMWILWLPQSGYGPFVSVPPFTLWIVWLGWFSRTRHNLYLGEIIFRIFNTVLLYTVFRWIFILNIPPDNVGIPLEVVHSIVFKEAINGLFILFLTQGVLYLGTVRRFFGLQRSTTDPRMFYICTNALILGGILIFSSIGERYIWFLWGSDFQYAARFLGSLLLLTVGILCTYYVANIFVKRKTEEFIRTDKALRENEKKLLQIVEGTSIPLFVINKEHTVTHWNKACENLTDLSASEMVGVKKQWLAFYPAERPVMADLVVDELSEEEITKYYGNKYKKSAIIDGAYEAEDFFPTLGDSGKWLFFTAAPLRDYQEKVIGAIETLQDITERKQAEDSIRRLAMIAEQAAEGIAMADLNGILQFVNSSWAKMHGYETGEELVGKHISVFHTAEQIKTFVDPFNEKVKRTGQHLGESEQMRKDGTTFPSEVAVTLFKDESGKFVGILAFAIDITERKQASEVVREREQQLSVVLDNATIHIWSFDGECYPYLSAEWYRYTGQDTTLARTLERWTEVVHPDDLNEAIKTWHAAWTSKGVYDDNFRLKNAKGEYRLFHSHAVPIYDEKGNVQHYQGYNLDITERKRAEDALRKSEERFQQVVENAQEWIWEMNADGLYTYASPVVEALLGYSPEEVVGKKHFYDLQHPDDREELRKISFEMFARKEPFSEFLNRNIHKDGRTVWLSTSGFPMLDEAGRILGYRGVDADVTERRRAGAMLKQTVMDLERSNAELEQFAYVASHDLQEPLRMVSSYTQLLERRYREQLDDDADEFIAFVVNGVNRMQTLINDLLTYSRVGTQAKPSEPITCEVVLEKTLANLQLVIEESGAVVSHDTLPTVMADDLQLTQLFQNLIENAIKFHDEEPPHIHVSAEQKGNEWVFSVRDNGIGIEPEFFERIFTIFKRLHGKEEYSGTGIGLAVCKKIVERHGGHIWVESQPGEGSTFFFTFKSTRQNAESNRYAAEAA